MTTTTELAHPEGEARWVRDDRWGAVARVEIGSLLAAYEHLLVVAAHPDDECLGAGGLIADAASAGMRVTVLILTDGEASHPNSPTVSQDAMGVLRTLEADRAVSILAPGARVVHAGLPDGHLADLHPESTAAVDELLVPRTLVLAPWTSDGHPDHDAAGRAATTALDGADDARAESSDVAHYLVWLWHWGGLDDLPWERVAVVDVSRDAVGRRAGALSEHRTQVAALSSAVGDEQLLSTAVLAPSQRGFTTVVLPDRLLARLPSESDSAGVGDAFDAMFDDGDDPWSSESWYERRKRSVTLASLGRERYARALDLGSSTGVLTRELTHRVDHVVATDVSGVALDVARGDDVRDISWIQGEAPDVVNRLEGQFDLVVMSEVAYFLRPFDLWLTLAALLRRLEPGGELVLVDWRHPTQDIPSDGSAVHDQIHAVCRPWSTVRYSDTDVLLDVYVVPA